MVQSAVVQSTVVQSSLVQSTVVEFAGVEFAGVQCAVVQCAVVQCAWVQCAAHSETVVADCTPARLWAQLGISGFPPSASSLVKLFVLW